jgi:hypothetical protein
MEGTNDTEKRHAGANQGCPLYDPNLHAHGRPAAGVGD